MPLVAQSSRSRGQLSTKATPISLRCVARVPRKLVNRSAAVPMASGGKISRWDCPRVGRPCMPFGIGRLRRIDRRNRAVLADTLRRSSDGKCAASAPLSRDQKLTINPKSDQIQAVSCRTARTLNPMRTAEFRGSLPHMQVRTTTPTPIICSWFESRYPSTSPLVSAETRGISCFQTHRSRPKVPLWVPKTTSRRLFRDSDGA